MTLKISGAKNHKAVITNARKNIYKKGTIIKNCVIRRRPRAKQSWDWKLIQLQLSIAALALKHETKTASLNKNVFQGDQVVRTNSKLKQLQSKFTRKELN